MRFRTFLLFLLLALTALFALVNWPAFTAPTTLSLVLGTVTAPLGLIMLGVVFVLGAMSLAYLIYVQGSALLDARRHARELQLQRDRVDNAEASRLTELHRLVSADLQRLEQLQADTRQQLLSRLDQLEHRLLRLPADADRLQQPAGGSTPLVERGPSGLQARPNGTDPRRY